MVFENKKEKGASFLEMMVVVGIIGVIAFIYGNMSSNNLNTENKLTTANELEELRKYVRIGTDLAKTKAVMPNPCATDTIISLKRNNSVDLVKNASGASRTKIGNYYLDARCFDATKPGEVQVYYTKNANQANGTKLFAVPLVIP